MSNFSFSSKINSFLLLIILLNVLFNNIHCKHNHHSKSNDNNHQSSSSSSVKFDMDGDPNEILPAPCVNGEVMTRAQHQADLDSWENCPVKREQVMAINKMGFDINGDGSIDMDECNKARKYYLTWYERQFVESCDEVFDHCDCDGDGYISQKDFEMSVFTCLRNCSKGKLIQKYIGGRMVGNKAFVGVKNQ